MAVADVVKLHREVKWDDLTKKQKLLVVLGRELHFQFMASSDKSICSECQTSWPCATIQAANK